MTTLSKFFNLLRLQVNIYHNAKVCGSWGIYEDRPKIASFHIVTVGDCLIDIPNFWKTTLNKGDLIIFPKGVPHEMRPIKKLRGKQVHLPYMSPREGTGLLCAEVEVNKTQNGQLLDALPEIVLIRSGESTEWLTHLTTLIVNESISSDPINSTTINRLTELLFIYALRHFLKNTKIEKGIFALYSHIKIAKALDAFHSDIQAPWSINDLALLAGLSRTIFSEKFKKISGWTINQYKIWWRMQVAVEQLKNGQKVAEVANNVGYQSEASFSRAFLKHFKINPGQVRRAQGF